MSVQSLVRIGGAGLTLLALWLCGSSHLFANEGQLATQNIPPSINSHSLSSLNIRLSQRPISPPDHLVIEHIDLTEVHPARMLIGPSPQAAILEDDYHQRVMILSALENGQVRAHLLQDINFSSKIPFITACAQDRECAYDRRPVTGGLGCIAICVQQAFSLELIP